jgi:hypothetical protein
MELLRERLERVVEEEHLESLQQNGFAIIDDFLGSEWSGKLLGEIKHLHENKKLHPNAIRFMASGDESRAVDVIKPHIFEMDLHWGEEGKSAVAKDLEDSELMKLFKNSYLIAEQFNRLDPNLCLETDPDKARHTLKVQCNEGHGGCFPWHYDNPGRDRRRLSCLLYLNEDWEDSRGGQIEVAPFLQRKAVVEPLFDRLVIFYSETSLHRVAPAYDGIRYCLTIWLDHSSDRRKEDLPRLPWPGMEDYLDSDALFKSLSDPTLQRTLSRALYDEEYEVSIRDCMGQDSKGMNLLLQAHHDRVATLKSHPRLGPLINHLKQLKISIL